MTDITIDHDYLEEFADPKINNLVNELLKATAPTKEDMESLKLRKPREMDAETRASYLEFVNKQQEKVRKS